MALTVQSFEELDKPLVAEIQARMVQLFTDYFPEIQQNHGVIRDLLLYLAGVTGAVAQTEVARVQSARSLKQITADPLLADPAVTDDVLSMYRVTRQPGGIASGQITIIVSADVTIPLPLSMGFTSNGVRFVLPQAYSAKSTTATLTDPSDRQLVAVGDGTFAFTVPLSAELVGASGNIKRGSIMTPDRPFTYFLTAYASTDFAGGDDTETNQELIDRLDEGAAAKTFSSEPNIVAMIRNEPQFAKTVNYSILGLGDPEMTRDQHSVIPISGGGRLDVYARTGRTPQQFELRKQATLVGTNAAGGVWQFSLGRDDAPGFYEVVQVRRPADAADAAGYEVIFDLRGFDLSGEGFRPDVVTALEATYTPWQTAVIRFVDTETSTTGLTVGTSKADYLVAVSAMPQLRDLQRFLGDNSVRNKMTDVLVKGPIPCFVEINFEIQQASGQTPPDLQAVRQAVADMVNTMGFTGKIHASKVADVVHNFLTSKKQGVGPIDVRGRIRRPDGTMAYIHDLSVMEVPDDPGRMVTPSTVAFILFAEDVGVSVVTAPFGAGV